MTGRRPCPVCLAAPESARTFLEENLDPARLSSFSFASRKEPEYMCYRLLQCRTCDLVYADQPPGIDELARGYHDADFDTAVEADDAASAYLGAFRATLLALPRRESALEIGTGTGVFLEHLSGEGFGTLVGVEPSAAAIAAAPPNRRSWIREGLFSEADFAPGSFDLICCFMTLEHVLDPMTTARAALRLLRPGGAFVVVTHDYRSVVNRLMGRRSPIVDVEHLQLFSQRSARQLFERAGYQGVTCRAFANTYRLRYWLRLAPLPRALKRTTVTVVAAMGLANVKVSLKVGNLATAGFAPGAVTAQGRCG